jgi:hypothetical protein
LTPALLTRLKALQTLHTEAASFGQSVKVISEEQTRMTDELKSLTTTCELVSCIYLISKTESNDLPLLYM